MAKQQKQPTSKNMVSVGRLKQVSDSLKTTAKYKGEESLGKMFRGAPDKKSASKIKKEITDLNNSRQSDLNRAKKYDKIIQKATLKKKK